MPVNLKFYDETGTTPIQEEGLDLGKLYKGQQQVTGFTIKNDGDVSATNIKLSLEGADTEASGWKSLGFSPNGIFYKTLEIQDIKPGAFMPGYAVYSSQFEVRENDWVFTNDESSWEFYNANAANAGYLHHLKSPNNGRALAGGYPSTKNCDTTLKITVPSGTYGGIQLRADNVGTGYFILINSIPIWIDEANWTYGGYPNFTNIEHNEAVIQIWAGSMLNWSKLYTFPVGTGVRSVFDNFRVKVKDFTFECWYNDRYIGKWTDTNGVARGYDRAGQFALIANGAGVIAFDSVEYKIETNMGAVYLKDVVGTNAVPSEHQTRLKVEYDE